MKYQKPLLLMLGAQRGAGWCYDGSGAAMVGVPLYCKAGTYQEDSASLCTNGTGNMNPFELCIFGETVSNPPGCLFGLHPSEGTF